MRVHRKTCSQTQASLRAASVLTRYVRHAEAHATGNAAGAPRRQADAPHCVATEDPSTETGGTPVPAAVLGASAPKGGGLLRQFSDSASSLRAQAALGAAGQGKQGLGYKPGSEAGSAIAVPGGGANWRPSGAPASLPDMRLGEAGGLGATDPERGSLRSGGTMAQAEGMEEAASAQHSGSLVTKRSLSFDSERGRHDGGGDVPGEVPGFHWAAPPKPGADELRHAEDPSASPGPPEDALARRTSAQVCSMGCLGCGGLKFISSGIAQAGRRLSGCSACLQFSEGGKPCPPQPVPAPAI